MFFFDSYFSFIFDNWIEVILDLKFFFYVLGVSEICYFIEICHDKLPNLFLGEDSIYGKDNNNLKYIKEDEEKNKEDKIKEYENEKDKNKDNHFNLNVMKENNIKKNEDEENNNLI